MKDMQFSDLISATETHTEVMIPGHIVWGAVGFIILVTVLLGIILLYHWKEYGYFPRKNKIATVTFLAGAIILLSLIIGGAVIYTSS